MNTVSLVYLAQILISQFSRLQKIHEIKKRQMNTWLILFDMGAIP